MMLSLALIEGKFDTIGQWPTVYKLVFLFGLSLSTLVVGYWLLLINHIEQYNDLRHQEVTLKFEFERKAADVIALKTYSSKLQLIQTSLESFLSHDPKKNKSTMLIDQLFSKGTQAGLKFSLFVPQSEIKHELFVELPIKLSLRGTYSQFDLFLKSLAKLSLLVTLQDLKIKTFDSDANSHSIVKIMEMTIKTHLIRYREFQH
ncbi:MAG: type 4a pilus biogenesis protein PilO [Legionella sp.]|nr:type 4a pilus biogenesis protein PilO [Legionella sp.]